MSSSPESSKLLETDLTSTVPFKLCSSAIVPTHPSMACTQDEREGGGQALHMNLLQALLCAGMHSRAAYGYAMAAGHLSSLLNFALLQTVGRLILASPLPSDMGSCLGHV